MPYYLTQYIEGPQRGKLTPHIPAGSDQLSERNWIRLEPRGKVLLWAAKPVIHPLAILLADDEKTSLDAKTKDSLAGLCGDRTFASANNLKEIIIGMLNNAPAGKWQSIIGNIVTQRKEIWLGPGTAEEKPFWSEKVFIGPQSKTIADNFTGTNGTELNGRTSSDTLFSWVDATNVFQINGNAAIASGLSDGRALANLSLDTVDHYVQATLGSWTWVIDYMAAGIGCRQKDDRTEGYEFWVNGQSVIRNLWDIASAVDLCSDTTNTSSGILYLSASGSTITAKVAGTNIGGSPVTDATPSNTYKKTSIFAYSDNAVNSFKFDDFSAADLVTDLYISVAECIDAIGKF